MRRDISSGPLQKPRGFPIGSIVMYGAVSAPASWLLCDGSAISRIIYSVLLGIIGTAFGAGDGSTTFNVPDFKGRFAVGKDDLGGSSANRVTASQADNIGQGSGAESHQLTVAEMAAHTHGVGTSVGATGAAVQAVTHNTAGDSSSSTGGDGAHNNMSPYQTVAYIIRVS